TSVRDSLRRTEGNKTTPGRSSPSSEQQNERCPNRAWDRYGVVYEGRYRWEGARMMVLLRHLLGDVLRRLRQRQRRTLRQVSAEARVSLGYLSEVERGQKEASAELLSSICTALGVPLSQVLREVSDQLAL